MAAQGAGCAARQNAAQPCVLLCTAYPPSLPSFLNGVPFTAPAAPCLACLQMPDLRAQLAGAQQRLEAAGGEVGRPGRLGAWWCSAMRHAAAAGASHAFASTF